MEPFKISPYLLDLTGTYPDIDMLVKAAKNGGDESKIAIARLWLSEGIPFAFQKIPALYESIRTWLGYRLDVNPKEISITGSGRIGKSLSPNKFGKIFDKDSDLDLFIISDYLFEKMKNDFEIWSLDYKEGIVKPKEYELKYWDDNYSQVPKNIKKGFLNSDRVPNRENYKTIKIINQAMSDLKKKLEKTTNAPLIKKASVRCYKNWDSYVQQMLINLK